MLESTNPTGTPPPLKQRRRILARIGLFSAIGAVFFAAWLAAYAISRGPANQQDALIVYIPKGSSVRQIGHLLGEAGLINDDIRFLLLAHLSGLASKLQAGEFQLDSGLRPISLMQALRRAVPVQHAITIPEGLRASEIAKLFADNGWCDARSYESLVENRTFIESLGLKDLSSLEGYLYPDTYHLSLSMKGAEALISLQVKRFEEVWNELTAAGPGSKTLDRQKAVILASMVEKETAEPSERPLIAAVFLRRLELGMRLQSDPTVVYGLKGSTGNLTKLDLQTPSPYNTYIVPALPAGPIANPGKEALQAVLQPVATSYLYFVSKNDGTHHFSANLKEHNSAVQTYQRKHKDGAGQ